MGTLVDTATMITVMSENRVDSGSFRSRYCAFRRTHTSEDPIWLLYIRLALPLTISWPLGFAPSERLVIGVSSFALWVAGTFLRDCMFLKDVRGRFNRQLGPLLNTATTTTVMSANHLDSGKFSSRCCTFRRTNTSEGPIRLVCIRVALPLTVSLPSGFAPSERLPVVIPTWALWLAENLFHRKKVLRV